MTHSLNDSFVNGVAASPALWNLTARVDEGMDLSPARRPLRAVRYAAATPESTSATGSLRAVLNATKLILGGFLGLLGCFALVLIGTQRSELLPSLLRSHGGAVPQGAQSHFADLLRRLAENGTADPVGAELRHRRQGL